MVIVLVEVFPRLSLATIFTVELPLDVGVPVILPFS